MAETTKKVKYRDFQDELDKLREKLGSLHEVKVDFHNLFSYFDKNEKIEIGINWCALGTVTVEETEKFIETLQKACELAKSFKYNGYTIEW